jgi:CRP/FNR family transcriptional regulator
VNVVCLCLTSCSNLSRGHAFTGFTPFNGRQLSAQQCLLRFIKGLCECDLLHDVQDRSRVHLLMPKTDIASYLGVRPESVSRALTNLQKQCVIRNYHRCIEIDDRDFTSG